MTFRQCQTYLGLGQVAKIELQTKIDVEEAHRKVNRDGFQVAVQMEIDDEGSDLGFPVTNFFFFFLFFSLHPTNYPARVPVIESLAVPLLEKKKKNYYYFWNLIRIPENMNGGDFDLMQMNWVFKRKKRYEINEVIK